MMLTFGITLAICSILQAEQRKLQKNAILDKIIENYDDEGSTAKHLKWENI